MIHLIPNGIYADTREEVKAFYDRLHTGDPVILGHLMLYEIEKHLLKEDPIEALIEGVLL